MPSDDIRPAKAVTREAICDAVALLSGAQDVFRNIEGQARAFVRIPDVNSGDANSVVRAPSMSHEHVGIVFVQPLGIGPGPVKSVDID